MAELTKSQKNKMKKHKKHHSKKHIREMLSEMLRGGSFSMAHKKAMNKVGK